MSRTLLVALGAGAAILAMAWCSIYPETHEPTSKTPDKQAHRDSDSVASLEEPPPEVAIVLEAETPEEVRDVVRFARNAAPDDISTLKRMALESEDPLVVGNAIRALGRLGTLAEETDLSELLDDPRLRVRQETIKALGESGDPEAVAVLASRLEDSKLRPLVIRALGSLGGPLARQHICSILDDASSTRTERVFARAALKSIDLSQQPKQTAVTRTRQ